MPYLSCIDNKKRVYLKIMSQPEADPRGEIELHPLEEDGLLERLIDQHRMPTGFMLGMPGTLSFCYLPPEETQPGDKVTELEAVGLESDFVVTSPTGKVRGAAELVIMTDEQTVRILQRIRDHLKPAPLDEVPLALDSQDRSFMKLPMIGNSKPVRFVAKLLQQLQR